MIYLFLIICLCVLIFAQDYMVLAVSAEHLLGAFSYQFAHAGWLHYIINAISLMVMFNPIYRLYTQRCGDISTLRFFIYCYLGSVLAALFCAQVIPTVGASGIVFFLLGILLMLNPTRRQLSSYMLVLLAIAMQFLKGNSNIALHIIAFVLGCLFVIIRLLWQYQKSYISYDDRGN